MKVIKEIEGLDRAERDDVQLAELLLNRKLPAEVVAAIVLAKSHREVGTAVRRIAEGSSVGPTGLELLAIAIGGNGFTTAGDNATHSVAGALASVSSRLAELLETLREREGG